MRRDEFDFCMEEAKKMFFMKDMNPHFTEVFFDEFGHLERNKFLKGLATTAAHGKKLTIEGVTEGLLKATKAEPLKQRIVTDCRQCNGDGSIVMNNFAYSCNLCKAAENYPNYPKYNNQKNESLKVTEFEDHYLREFYAYKIKVPKNMESIKDLVFEHAYSLVPKTTTTNNKNELKKPSFGDGL